MPGKGFFVVENERWSHPMVNFAGRLSRRTTSPPPPLLLRLPGATATAVAVVDDDDDDRMGRYNGGFLFKFNMIPELWRGVRGRYGVRFFSQLTLTT